VIVKTDLDPKVVWRLEAVAEKQGLTLSQYLAQLATAEVQRPVVRVDWYEGSANQCIRLFEYQLSNTEVSERLGLSLSTVKRRRRIYDLATRNVEASS